MIMKVLQNHSISVRNLKKKLFNNVFTFLKHQKCGGSRNILSGKKKTSIKFTGLVYRATSVRRVILLEFLTTESTHINLPLPPKKKKKLLLPLKKRTYARGDRTSSAFRMRRILHVLLLLLQFQGRGGKNHRFESPSISADAIIIHHEPGRQYHTVFLNENEQYHLPVTSSSGLTDVRTSARRLYYAVVARQSYARLMSYL